VHAREQPHIDKITIDLTWIEEKDGVVVWTERKSAELDMQETILYWVLSLGIGASSCSGSLKIFCGIGWAAEGTGARRLKSGLGTDFCQRCGGPNIGLMLSPDAYV
jgi:hypothetical protein